MQSLGNSSLHLVQMMKQDGLGWKKDLGLARLLRNHYNVNYNINLRMFLKGKNKTISLLDSNPRAEQKKIFPSLKTTRPTAACFGHV